MMKTHHPHVGSLELFRIGIGPSSSHTVGPMRAARAFALSLEDLGMLSQTRSVRITLYGSLGATGSGHGTLGALVAGLSGAEPETCDPSMVANAFETAIQTANTHVMDQAISFDSDSIRLAPLTRLAHHSNGIRFEALGGDTLLLEETYFSVGGGFIEKEGAEPEVPVADKSELPYRYESASQLIALTTETGMTIADIALTNDSAVHGEEATSEGLASIWSTMQGCIESGLEQEGVLPGPMAVPRRAPGMARKLRSMDDNLAHESDWLQAFAIAVNEENAAGHRVVTAPTNGAAGIIPAVGYWAHRFMGVSLEDITHVYLPTAAAIGFLYKRNASISGAEAGCQGEVGSACSMAAAGVTALMGGTPQQVENAAEIAMEHNLGLTCDPVGGFVQLPCIERNAIAAGTAVSAMRLAMLGDGSHKISLDTVIETMRQTGLDMSTKYKETSLGGLAVNVIEC